MYTYNKDASETYVSFGMFILKYSVEDTQRIEREEMYRRHYRERNDLRKKQLEQRYQEQRDQEEKALPQEAPSSHKKPKK